MKKIKEILTIDEHLEQMGERSIGIDTVNEGPEMREIITSLKDTMNDKDLIALSAPQIGFNRRIFCIRFSNEIKTFINPIIANAKPNSLELSREKSPSVPGKEYIVPRNNTIDVMYQKPLGQPQSRQFVGLAAFTFQRMLNYLDGVFISDIGLEVLEGFDEASEEEKNEILGMYLDSLDLKLKDLNAEIQADPELKQLDDGIKYMESIYKGETQLYVDDENGELSNGKENSNDKSKEKCGQDSAGTEQ